MIGHQSLEVLGQVETLLGLQGKMLLTSMMTPTGVVEQVRGASCGAVWGMLQVQWGKRVPCLVLGSDPKSDPGSAGEGSELLPVPCPIPGKCPIAVHVLPAPSLPLKRGCLRGVDPGHAPPVLLPWGWFCSPCVVPRAGRCPGLSLDE